MILSCGKPHTDREILSAAGRINAKRRKHNVAGPGRRKLVDRCPCGRYSRAYAARRGHRCVAS